MSRTAGRRFDRGGLRRAREGEEQGSREDCFVSRGGQGYADERSSLLCRWLGEKTSPSRAELSQGSASDNKGRDNRNAFAD